MPSLRTPSLLVLVMTTAWASPIVADEFRHEANILGKLGNHPNVVTFIGPSVIDVGFETDARGHNNPLYQGSGMSGEMPLYEGSADPGTPYAIQSITFDLDTAGLPAITLGNGVVHRDIAARNVLVQTNGGIYESGPDAFLLFGNDGPTDIRSNVGPVRWMAPESLRLTRNGSTDPNDYIDIQAGSFFDVSYVPEPGSALLMGMVGLALTRRRR